MVGSGGDRQERQTRLGAKQLSAAMLVLENYKGIMSCTKRAFQTAIVEMMGQAGSWECGINVP